ncbi:MAG: cytochrome d ubiquinol oxidase subunit II, partial [Bacteroidota bacterium]
NLIHPDHFPSLVTDPNSAVIPTPNYADLYIFGWFNGFSLLMGLFVAALSAMSAAVFMIGETAGAEQAAFRQKARRANLAAIATGALVLLEAFLNERPFADIMLDRPLGLATVAVVTLLAYPLWQFLAPDSTRTRLPARAIYAAQIFLILFAWACLAFPDLIQTRTGALSLLDNVADPAVIEVLVWALIAGGAIILPGVWHLFRVFGLLG